MIAILKRISIASGLLAALAAAPALAGDRAANQATADAVATALRTSPALIGERVDIDARDGVVTLTGDLSSAQARIEALEKARRVAGVNTVLDALRVTGDSSVDAAQYEIARGGMRPGTVIDGTPIGGGSMMGGGPMMGGGSMMGGGPMMGGSYMADGAMMGGAGMNGAMMGGSNMGGPLPEGPAGFSGGTQASQPGYPNYAWPSYAPYPNFSAVGYPTAYPWQAWPNIGPFYPYPEVPLDWRAVTLRWDDGIWFLDFKKHYTRPFFTPYPFGLFAY